MNSYRWSFMFIWWSFSVSSWASNTSISNTYIYQDEIRSLSELPLDKLIQIKSSFSKRSLDGSAEPENMPGPEARTPLSYTLPMAMPLKRMGGVPRPMRRYEEWEEKGKGDSKISKIFQLTVTALSFLAFGGYLLTLIITAIRRNQGNGSPGVVVLSNINGLQKIKRPKRGLVIYDPAENEYDTELMYRGMIMLSNDYSRHYY